MRKKMRLFVMSAAVAATLGLASHAQALSFNGMLLSIAAQAGTPNIAMTFNDVSAGAVSFDFGADGIYNAGDKIRGTFIIHQLQTNTGLGGSETTGGANAEISGRFALEIVSATAGPGTVTLVYGPDATSGMTAGAVIELYQDGPPPVTPHGALPGLYSATKYSDGDLLAALGFTGGGGGAAGFYAITFFEQVIDGVLTQAELAGLGSVGIVGFGASGLNILDDGTSDGGDGIGNYAPITPAPSGTDFSGIVSINNVVSSGTSFTDTADFTVNLTVVPLPAAALPGMMLLGALGLYRLRRRRMAA
jgi:hypothetical protein